MTARSGAGVSEERTAGHERDRVIGAPAGLGRPGSAVGLAEGPVGCHARADRTIPPGLPRRRAPSTAAAPACCSTTAAPAPASASTRIRTCGYHIIECAPCIPDFRTSTLLVVVACYPNLLSLFLIICTPIQYPGSHSAQYCSPLPAPKSFVARAR